jgi:hypothetical protein
MPAKKRKTRACARCRDRFHLSEVSEYRHGPKEVRYYCAPCACYRATQLGARGPAVAGQDERIAKYQRRAALGLPLFE